MVDFPERYGFEPGGKAKLMQNEYAISIGCFVWVGYEYTGYGKGKRNRSPWRFAMIGTVYKKFGMSNVKGVLLHQGPPIEGSLQQVVTAMCTIHRMTWSK